MVLAAIFNVYKVRSAMAILSEPKGPPPTNSGQWVFSSVQRAVRRHTDDKILMTKHQRSGPEQLLKRQG